MSQIHQNKWNIGNDNFVDRSKAQVDSFKIELNRHFAKFYLFISSEDAKKVKSKKYAIT